jgi:hypothetical protein
MKYFLIAALFVSSVHAIASEREPGLNVNPIPFETGSVACRDGQKITVLEPTQNDSAVKVVYTCKNGKYVETAPAKSVTCNEGETIRVLEANQNDSASWVSYVCRSGKFVR